MVDIRPKDLPDAILPLRDTDELIVDQGTDGVRKAPPSEAVNSVAPVVSQADAVAGADNVKRMTSLRTKQSIASEVGITLASNYQGAKADSAVQSVNGKSGNSVTIVKGDVGLGNVDNTSDLNKPISTATQAQLDNKLNVENPVCEGIFRNNEDSFPIIQNEISTTATYTSGSPVISVPSGLSINNGDSVRGDFLPFMTYVVSGGGTTSLTLSRTVNSSGSSTAIFGNNRWDLDSTTVGDTAGYRRLYVGAASQGRSTMQPQINGAGLDYQEVTAMSVENENGGVGLWAGSRMSKENTGLHGIISMATYCLIDEDPISRHAWNRYEQSNLNQGTTPTGNSVFCHVEASLESYWDTVSIDPYSTNKNGSTRIYRYDPGIGDYASRGDPNPNNISAYMDLVNNGAKAQSGIVFGKDSIDESVKQFPPAIAFPNNYSITWYGSENIETFRIFSSETTVGNEGYLWHGNKDLTVGDLDLAISKDGISSQKNVCFRTSHVNRWTIGSSSTTESGGNAGSDITINRWSDSGSYIDTPFYIIRSTGGIVLETLRLSSSYANDADAAAGGVAIGELYRDGSNVKIRIS